MNTSFEPKSQVPTQKAPHQESQNAKAYPSRTIVHAKLEMTEPGDHDEREADAVASTIMSGGKIARKISSGGNGSSGIAVSSQMESQLNHLQGGGQAMPEGLRNMMEKGFGQDFGQVRLHTDSEAANLSSSINAKAFTHGNDIYFNHGQFSPETSEGQRLVAHELTHVVQGIGKVGREPNDNPYQKVYSFYFQYGQDTINYDIDKKNDESQTNNYIYFLKRTSNKNLADSVKIWFRIKIKTLQRDHFVEFLITKYTTQHKDQDIELFSGPRPYDNDFQLNFITDRSDVPKYHPNQYKPNTSSIPMFYPDSKTTQETDETKNTIFHLYEANQAADLSNIRMPIGNGIPYIITQGFESQGTHKSDAGPLNKHAIDIAIPNGQQIPQTGIPIVAVDDGIVIRVINGITQSVSINNTTSQIGSGNHVYILHTKQNSPLYGYVSIYLHLENDENNNIMPKLGETVTSGQRIGIMGNTGRSSGRHLHFSIVRYEEFNNEFNATDWSLNGKMANDMKNSNIRNKTGAVNDDGTTTWN